LPNGLAKVTIKTQQHLIFVSNDTQYSYNCKIIKSTDIPNEKFVGRAFNRYVNPEVPEVGDHFKFELDQTNQYLLVYKFPPQQE
jgi:hypothetical protein